MGWRGEDGVRRERIGAGKAGRERGGLEGNAGGWRFLGLGRLERKRRCLAAVD